MGISLPPFLVLVLVLFSFFLVPSPSIYLPYQNCRHQRSICLDHDAGFSFSLFLSESTAPPPPLPFHSPSGWLAGYVEESDDYSFYSIPLYSTAYINLHQERE